jgi:Tol biopolymer transport system component
LVYTSSDGQDDEIYTINPESGAIEQLTDNASNESLPLWSPDGHYIAFMEWNNSGTHPLYVMKSDGSNVRRVADDIVVGEFSETVR